MKLRSINLKKMKAPSASPLTRTGHRETDKISEEIERLQQRTSEFFQGSEFLINSFLIFLTGPGVIGVYIIMALIIPEAPVKQSQ